MKKVLLFNFLLIAVLAGHSQPLAPGSIAFLGFQSDAPDGFAFVNLVIIPANTSISFTDNAWSGTALFSNENTAVWTSPGTDIPPGTIVYIYNPSGSTSAITGPGTVNGALNGLAAAGDQILAYTGEASNPSFIAGISSNQWLSVCNATSGGSGNNNTCLPAPLIDGIHAISFTGGSSDKDNGFFNLSSLSGTPGELLSRLNDRGNWLTDDEPAAGGAGMWPEWNITVTEPGLSYVYFETSAVSIAEGGPAETVTLIISPPASGPQLVSIQADLNGSVSGADIITTPAHTDGHFDIPVAMGVSHISFQVAAAADAEEEGDELSTFTISNVTSGLMAVEPHTISFLVTEPGIFSFVSFAPGTSDYFVTEGDSVTMNLQISPAPASAESFDISLSFGPGLTAADFSSDPAAAGSLIQINLQPGQATVEIKIRATDDFVSENTETLTLTLSNLSAGLQAGLATTVTVSIEDNDQAVGLPTIRINELQSNNTGTITDENEEYDDWIELYNYGNEPVDIAGLYITDDKTNPAKYQFPTMNSETVIPAGGFLIVWADDTPAQGPLHTNFALSANGEFVGLYAMAGGNAVTVYLVIDSVSFGPLQPDISYGRQTDGGLPWVTFDTPTPGESNEPVGIAEQLPGRLSVYPNPAGETIRVTLPEQVEGTVILFRLLDVNGRMVHSYAPLSYRGSHQLTMPGVAKGLYVLQAVSAQRQWNTLISISE